MQVQVLDQCSFSNMFSITNEVKQGCVLAPTTFYILLAAVIYDAFKDTKCSGCCMTSKIYPWHSATEIMHKFTKYALHYYAISHHTIHHHHHQFLLLWPVIMCGGLSDVNPCPCPCKSSPCPCPGPCRLGPCPCPCMSSPF